MHLGVLLLAAGNVVSGCVPEARPVRRISAIIQVVEKPRAKLDFIFLADGLNSFSRHCTPSDGAALRAADAARRAGSVPRKQIGLGVTASTTYTEPYNLARMLPRSII